MSITSTVPVSVIIMTKNEERVLPHTLASVAEFDQVFVVDSHSTDGTRTIAEQMGADVVSFAWDGQYPKKKEWSLLNLPLKNPWVLYLDADELVTPSMTEELRWRLGSPVAHAAFDIELDYHFLGKQLKHGHRVTKRALVHRERTTWPHVDDLAVSNMWEVEGHYQPVVDGTIGRLRTRIEHNDRDPLFDYFSRHNRYSDWEAYLATHSDLERQLGGFRSPAARRYRSTPFKPLAFFFYSYFLKRGFLDGSAGLHYSLAQAFYYWQIHVKTRFGS